MNLLPTMADQQNEPKGLKAVLPYWPVIAFCVMCLTSLGGILVKLDYITKAVDKNEIQFTSIGSQMGVLNDRQNLTSQSIIEMRGINERQTFDISRIEKGLVELQTIKRNERWMPK